MKKIENVYLGGGFQDSQILWVSKILYGYEKYPKKIILERKFNKVIMNDLKKTFPNSKIFLEKNRLKENNLFLKYIHITLFILLNFNTFIFFFLKLNKRKDNFKNSYENQIINSIWDSSLNIMEDNQLKPNIFQKFIGIFRSIYALSRAEKLINKFGINLAILGHAVYSSRAMIAYFRKKNIKIYCQAAYNIYDISRKENAWNQISQKNFIYLKKKINNKNFKKYWQDRLQGRGNYYDSKVASNLKNKLKHYPKNVILLHIFKDSPFNYIDPKRIFYDYFDWIDETLKILVHSNEKWSLRLHPNASRWGENQKIIVQKYLERYPQVKNKIFIDNSYVSNNFVFNHVNRLVTYSGTSHLEASCFKIKPIMISRSSLECINSNYVNKPKNIKEYKKFLLCNSSNKIFRQSNKISNLSKELLFIRENILTLINDLNGIFIYRSDNKKIIKKEFLNIYKNLKYSQNYLKQSGKDLRNRFSHCFAKIYKSN